MGRLGHGGGGGSSGKDGTERLQRRTWWKGPWSRGEHEEDGAISQNYDRQFGSLPIAGHLWRGTPVGGRVVGGQGHQGPVTRGLSKGFKLPGEHAAPADTQEGRQASAQALGRLHPGAVMEELAHGVSGEVVRKHGRRGRHVPLGLGGGGAVGLQKGQVAAAEAALFHDATAAAVHTAGRSAWKSHRRKERAL